MVNQGNQPHKGIDPLKYRDYTDCAWLAWAAALVYENWEALVHRRTRPGAPCVP